jgi:hypothetical protein
MKVALVNVGRDLEGVKSFLRLSIAVILMVTAVGVMFLSAISQFIHKLLQMKSAQ